MTQHVWEKYIEICEDIRHTLGNKEIYALRKETIERIYAIAKENHGFRYTQYIGKARMQMKAGFTFTCINLKKLARILQTREQKRDNLAVLREKYIEKFQIFMINEKWCYS